MKISESPYWAPLWQKYSGAPSIALCRVPELVYAADLDVSSRTLDHCCGDGYFASLAWPGVKMAAGCDISASEVKSASTKGLYERADVVDASKGLPYADGEFSLVFNNSAFEHIPDLDSTLKEVNRVLEPNGRLAFNVLNKRYFDWWPMSKAMADAYAAWQPFIHAFDLEGWKQALDRAGFTVETVSGYFDPEASGILAKLDHAFSGYYFGKHRSLLVSLYKFSVVKEWWKKKIENLDWKTEPDKGAGYFIVARKKG